MAGAALTSLAFLVIWGYRELLARRAFIHGTVTHEDRPLAGVSIRLERWTELPLGFTATEGRPIDFIPELIDSYETVTNVDGGFHLILVKPGRYSVSINRPDDGKCSSFRLWSGFEEIEIPAGVHTNDIWVKRAP
jgi:hypothetical protein